MNGVANSILSFLLSWIRALVYNLWAVVNSDDGGAAFVFLAGHWKTILLFLCIGGLIVDRIVYLLRWRPYYVWASRRDARRRIRHEKKQPPVQAEQPVWKDSEPIYETAGFQPAPTMAYAPLSQPVQQPTQFYAPVQEEEPVFDDPAMNWEDAQQEDWQQETLVAFGNPRPEPISYYRDVQAGFAPAVPPEQLYAPRQPYQQEQQTAVHPGLDDMAFRQSFGLEEEEPQPIPVLRAPAFRPFTAPRDEDVAPAKAQNPFARLARRARNLVGDDDENLSIRDLQSTVDVSQAFHEPVYPQAFKPMDDDR
ncbi:MAG: hypothetical protein IJ354_06575 [Clostridia bacterium]|nr:hypothetical protein [Clostridia bacterium]